MKTKYCFAAAFLLLFVACNNLDTYFKTSGQSKPETMARTVDITIIRRDTSLTRAVAYNDIFLDSMAVENYISNATLPADAARDIRNFYNARNYQFAWLYSGGFTEGGRDFWNLYTSDSTTVNKKKPQASVFTNIDSLMARDTFSVVPSDTTALETELFLTQRFVPFARTNLATVQVTQLLPVRKMTVQQWADTLLNQQNSDTANAAYSNLKNALQRYTSVARQGGWPQVPSVQGFEKNATAPQIAAIKKRLIASGDYKGNDTSGTFNDPVEMAIKNVQQQYGMHPDGRITDSFITMLNVPVTQRMQQLIVNMNRMLWMPEQKGNFIEVNIPEFMLHVYEEDTTAFSMPVVVGKEGSGTVLFTGRLNQLVFSPYWNIPASIVRDELLPAMKKDPAYLKSRNMEIVHKGDSLPVIRQLPGGDNALGNVKFLFPNRYDIYFHDTPVKTVFNQGKRAFSHGCIRLAEAEKLADYLLRDDASWPQEKIRQAMNNGTERYVKIKAPVPVVISYYTVWIDRAGQLNFRDDVYGHDKKSAGMLFVNNIIA